MIVINTLGTDKFTFNGIEYFKNFTSLVFGDYIKIQNTYNDITLKVLNNDLFLYSDITVDGLTYASPELLQSALLSVLYSSGRDETNSDFKLIDKVFNISHTGTTANVTVYTINIPANTFKEGSRFYVKAEIEKIDNNAVYALRFRFNNNLSTGLLYAKLNISATLDYYGFERTVSFTDTQAVTMRANAGSNNTDRNTSDVFSKVDFDTTQSADFELQVQLGSSLDTVIVRNLMLINIE